MAAMRTFSVATIAVAGALAVPAGASACSIAAPNPPPTAKEEVDHAKRAVYGEVVSRTPIGDDSEPTGNEQYRYRFRVIETYKGSVRRSMRIIAGTQTSLCEAGLLEVGDRFGLLLYKRRGPWRISITSFITRKRLRQSGYPARRA